MSQSVLVCAAHPDDEILGCGATMARHVDAGDRVHVVLFGEGVTSRRATRSVEEDQETLSDLGRAAHEANRRLGVTSLEIHRLPDNRMDSIDLLDVVKLVEAAIAKCNPSIVYTHHGGDLNIDHQIVHESVCVASRPIPGNPVSTLLFFEVLSSTDWRPATSASAFVPNWFVDVEATLARKLDALAAYETEMRDWPHSRSLRAVEHLARLRGASIGCQAAEAFALGRRIAGKGAAQ